MSQSVPIVLIVDDEPLIRELAGVALADAGCEVVEAANAAEARAVLKARPEVGVRFTDVNMPGKLDGLALARLVHAQWPAIKLTVTSGRPLTEPTPAHSRFVAKPYNLAALAETVTRLADAAPEPPSD